MSPSNSNAPRCFTFQDGRSNKFWEISISDCNVTVRFGRIGTQGQTQTKSFGSSSEAQTHHDKLVSEKLKKGYVEDVAKTMEETEKPAPCSRKSDFPDASSGLAATKPSQEILVDSHETQLEVHDAPINISPDTNDTNPPASSEIAETRALFHDWMSKALSDSTENNEPPIPEPEFKSDRPLTLVNIVEASMNGWAGTIASLFTGVSEPKRSALRKEFLKEHQLYGTLYTSETAPHWKKASLATKLLDIALGNKQELLYALYPSIRDFPKETIQILKERPADWKANAIERHLFANPNNDSFQTWAETVSCGLITTEWDDRTIRFIGNSNFRGDVLAALEAYVVRIPDLTKHLHRLLIVDCWGASDPQAIMMIISFLQNKGELNRLLWIRTALHGLYQVNNQNHTRSCQSVLEYLAPTVEELEQCQGDLAAVFDQAKPFVFESMFRLLERLLQESKLDGSLIFPSLSGIFSRAGIAQSKAAIQILASSADSIARPHALTAICSALLHSKREIGELAWKTLSTLLEPSTKHNDTVILEQLRTVLPHVSETLRRQIEKSPILDSTTEQSHIEPSPLEIPPLESFPSQVSEALQLGQTVSLLEQQNYIPCVTWSIMQAPVLSVQRSLEPISSLDELIRRLGAALVNGATVDERELLLDGICRFSRFEDPSFALKTAAIKMDADASLGFLNARWNADFAWLIRAWLGLPRPDFPERTARVCMEEISQHRSVAIEESVRQGNSTTLLSIATHSGGWIDPAIFLSRLEEAENQGKLVFLPDLELGILRLAPDGRTTTWRNSSLVERARGLKGPYVGMIRFAMGDDLPEAQMMGSQRLWVAAMKSREPDRCISDRLPFSLIKTEDGLDCKLPITAVQEPPKWYYPYDTKLKETQRGRGYRVSLRSGDLDRGMVYQPHVVSIGDRVAPAADNYFMTRFLAAQVFEVRFFHYVRRSFWPAQLDWYWYCLISNYVTYALDKIDFETFDEIEPLLESERPLTKNSARILWICSMTRAEKHRLWTIETWSKLVEDDRLDIPLLMEVLLEFKDQMWIVPKRWSEILAPVAGRSPLHAWDMLKLVMAMLRTFPFDSKDVAPLLEIVLEASTWLGLSADPSEIEVLQKFAKGKSKKLVDAIEQLKFVALGDAVTIRKQALHSRVNARLDRARRFSFSIK